MLHCVFWGVPASLHTEWPSKEALKRQMLMPGVNVNGKEEKHSFVHVRAKLPAMQKKKKKTGSAFARMFLLTVLSRALELHLSSVERVLLSRTISPQAAGSSGAHGQSSRCLKWREKNGSGYWLWATECAALVLYEVNSSISEWWQSATETYMGWFHGNLDANGGSWRKIARWSENASQELEGMGAEPSGYWLLAKQGADIDLHWESTHTSV